MSFLKEYRPVLAFLVLAFICIILLSTPGMLLSRGVSFVYANLSDPSANRTQVRLKMDFASAEQLNGFPREIGDWRGADYDIPGLAEQLGADVVLMRAYTKPGIYQPVFLLLMQSRHRSSFHPPEVCYPSLGYEITESGYDKVAIPTASWAEEPLYPRSQQGHGEGPMVTVPFKKLVIEEVKERQVVVYFYVEENLGSSNPDAVTMIRASVVAPTGGSYDSLLTLEKSFLAEAIPHLFEVREDEERIIVRLAGLGLPGVMVVIVSIGFPVGLVVYPYLRRFRLRRT